MEAETLQKLGKAGNVVLIIVNLVMFIAYQILNAQAKTAVANLDVVKFNQLLNTQNGIRVAVGIIAGLVLILTIICMVMNQGRLKGWGLLLPAAIVTIAFVAIGLMIGIIIWVLCGISISMLDKSYREYHSRETYGEGGDPFNNFGGVPLNNGFNGQDAYNQQGTYTDPFANQQNVSNDPFNNQNGGF